VRGEFSIGKGAEGSGEGVGEVSQKKPSQIGEALGAGWIKTRVPPPPPSPFPRVCPRQIISRPSLENNAIPMPNVP
jgi:hypothetical protein